MDHKNKGIKCTALDKREQPTDYLFHHPNIYIEAIIERALRVNTTQALPVRLHKLSCLPCLKVSQLLSFILDVLWSSLSGNDSGWGCADTVTGNWNKGMVKQKLKESGTETRKMKGMWRILCKNFDQLEKERKYYYFHWWCDFLVNIVSYEAFRAGSIKCALLQIRMAKENTWYVNISRI